MNEKDLVVMEQYDFLVKEAYRGRGYYVCLTDQGKKVLQEYNGSEKRAQQQRKLLLQLRGGRCLNVDVPVLNKEGNVVSMSKDERRFIVKDWVDGKECDVYHREDVKQAAANLAVLHKESCAPDLISNDLTGTSADLVEQVKKRNAELKKVRAFIRNKKNKTEFEFYYLQYFMMFYEKGVEVQRGLEDSSYERLLQKSMQSGQFVHGDYSQHNVLFFGNEIATVNFEHFKQDTVIADLAYFMRKILEKHEWEECLGCRILDEYDCHRPLSEEELQCLQFKLSYPEKFWKLTNHYYNANKAWASGRSTSKLVKLVAQETQKEYFIKRLLCV